MSQKLCCRSILLCQSEMCADPSTPLLGGPYDLPSHMLPENAARVGAISSFERLPSDELAEDGSIPGRIILQSGEVLCGIHHVIVCTGYHVSFVRKRRPSL